MGGYGSGRRWHYDAKSTTQQYRSLDVRQLLHTRHLTPGKSFTWHYYQNTKKVAALKGKTETDRIILSYERLDRDEVWQESQYSIQIEWTQCNYGGQRAWFRCPVEGCNRRVAILYAGEFFACRLCHSLAYPSQRHSSKSDKNQRNADKIRAKLGWKPGILNGRGVKPKGMHSRTYDRLCAEHDKLSQIIIFWMAQKIGILEK